MPPPPPSPTYGADAMARRGTNGKAIASMVMGIVGMLFFGIILGPLAIVFGFLARKEIATTRQSGNGMAIAGIVLGIIAVVSFFVFLGVYV